MFSINPAASTPIYRQIIDQVKEKILLGAFSPGDKLPSVRELATQITINPNTIQKAYQELERQNIIVTVQGRGTFVAERYEGKLDSGQKSRLQEYLRKGIIDGLYLGLSGKEITNIVLQLLDELEVRGEGHVKD